MQGAEHGTVEGEVSACQDMPYPAVGMKGQSVKAADRNTWHKTHSLQSLPQNYTNAMAQCPSYEANRSSDNQNFPELYDAQSLSTAFKRCRFFFAS